MAGKTARTLCTVLSALFLVCGAHLHDIAPAHADDDKEKAIRLLGQGDRYLEKAERRRESGREARAIHYFEKALAAYEQAFQLVPNPQIYYAIANAEAGLKRYAEALAHYRKVISEVDKPALVEEAKARIAELAPELGIITFEISPEGAELSINAELRGVSPLAEPIMLAPGQYTCTITAEGYNPRELTLDVEGGTKVEKEIALEKAQVLVKRPVEDADSDDKPDFAVSDSRLLSKPSTRVVVLGSLGTAVLLLASGATGVASKGDSNEFLYTSIGTGVVGIGLGAYTAYRYFKVYRPKKRQWERQISAFAPKFWLTPYVHADGGGVAAGGRF